MNSLRLVCTIILSLCSSTTLASDCLLRGSGDLAVVIERAQGSVKVYDTSQHEELFRITGLGDLSHASVVFSRDQRYAYVFGRDGGLSKLDLLCGSINKRIIQSGNSIGGAISQNGRLIAVSNYDPGGVKVFSAENLELIADLPAEYADKQLSKVIGLVDAPGNHFVYSLYDGAEIHLLNLDNPKKPKQQKFSNIGLQPYDGLITPDGRYYIAGLFGEDGLAKLDLWHPERGVKRILKDYGKGQKKLPVYKMPHLEGWAAAGNKIYLPAVGQHQVLVVNRNDWQPLASIDVQGQPVFVVARPDGRQVWVNFAHPKNDVIQIIDTQTSKIIKTLDTGPASLHMEFSSRGHELWLSVRDRNEIQIYDTNTLKRIKTLHADKPSGIFFSSRAHRLGL